MQEGPVQVWTRPAAPQGPACLRDTGLFRERGAGLC